MFKGQYFASALAAATVMATAAPAYAYVQPIYLEVNQSYYLPQNSMITRVAVTNPKIADVSVINKHALNIVALASGSTSLTVWTANGMRQEFTIGVSPSDKNMAVYIQKAIGLPNVKVDLVGDEHIGQKVLLRGKVTNQRERDMAVKIASMYVNEKAHAATTANVGNTMNSGSDDNALSLPNDDGDFESSNVINLLELENPDQINIESQVVEISTDAAKELGAEYSGTSITELTGSDSISTDSTGKRTVNHDSNVTTNVATGTGNFYTYGGYQTHNSGSHWYNQNWLFKHFTDINAKIHLLVSQGKARIISRPNITTMSGKNAGILIGGQIPYPKADENGSTTVDFKSYGIQLKLLRPEVDKEGNITAKLFAGVSRLDWTNAVTANGYNMPGLASRSAETMINIPSGMTMAIGGLMNSDEADSVSKVPLLGNIPLLGNLFKYHNKTKAKTEILILITPRVVNETTSVQMSQEMQKSYLEEKQADKAKVQVDLNRPVPQEQPQQSGKPVVVTAGK